MAPSGWPMAMAPPLTLVTSEVMPMSFMNRMATAAKASFISQRSMSPTSRPALASALRAAGAGPVSMMVGSAPETAAEMIRARGVRPSEVPTSSVPMATMAAPSTMPEELPAWWTWSIFSTQWYFSSATSSKPASRPMSANDGLRAASPSTEVSGRISSSWSRTVTPLMSRTGTTASAK